MRLADVIGHESTLKILRRLLERGRLPQTLCFEGPVGIGRRTMALALAQAVLCPEAKDHDACGQCQSCQLLTQGNHPDCTLLPTAQESGELAVALVKEQVVQPAAESAFMGHGRLFIIPDAERLRGPTANALLKIFEEPPEGTHFLLTTRRVSGLLETIRSRTQIVRMQPLHTAALAAILQRGGVSGDEALQRAKYGQGSHRHLWKDMGNDMPTEPLRTLLYDGHAIDIVADLMDLLPSHASQVPSGSTVSAEQRQRLRYWFDGLLEDLRLDLREGDAEAASRAIAKVLDARHALDRYIQPRLVLESLGL